MEKDSHYIGLFIKSGFLEIVCVCVCSDMHTMENGWNGRLLYFVFGTWQARYILSITSNHLSLFLSHSLYLRSMFYFTWQSLSNIENPHPSSSAVHWFYVLFIFFTCALYYFCFISSVRLKCRLSVWILYSFSHRMLYFSSSFTITTLVILSSLVETLYM